MPQVCPEPDIRTTNFRENVKISCVFVMKLGSGSVEISHRREPSVIPTTVGLMLTDGRKLPASDPRRSKANIGTCRNPVRFGIVMNLDWSPDP